MYAATVNKGLDGATMPIIKEFREAGVPLDIRDLPAVCQNCPKPAHFTARLTPIGETLVGDLDVYRACCEEHFYEYSCLHNPHCLLMLAEQISF